MSQSGLGLCPTQNQPNDIGFPARKPAANCKNQQIKLDQTQLASSQVGWSRWSVAEGSWTKKTPTLHQICAKPIGFEQKNTRSLPDLSKTHWIFAGFEQNPQDFH